MRDQEFIKKWNEECIDEGGRWAKSNLEDFSRKRALLFDSIFTVKDNVLFSIIIIASLALSYFLIPKVLFKGMMDYLVVIIFATVLFLISFYCWSRFEVNEKTNYDKGGNLNV